MTYKTDLHHFWMKNSPVLTYTKSFARPVCYEIKWWKQLGWQFLCPVCVSGQSFMLVSSSLISSTISTSSPLWFSSYKLLLKLVTVLNRAICQKGITTPMVAEPRDCSISLSLNSVLNKAPKCLPVGWDLRVTERRKRMAHQEEFSWLSYFGLIHFALLSVRFYS